MLERTAAPSEPLKLVFFSYAHKDRIWAKRLHKKLQPFQDENQLRLWIDLNAIRSGDKWEDEIDKALTGANAAVFLVSEDFLISTFIKKQEFPRLTAKFQREQLRFHWVLINKCAYTLWKFHQRQAAHDLERPLEGLKKAERNDVLWAIAEKIVESLSEPAEQTVYPEWPEADDAEDFRHDGTDTLAGAVPRCLVAAVGGLMALGTILAILGYALAGVMAFLSGPIFSLWLLALNAVMRAQKQALIHSVGVSSLRKR